MKSRLWIILPIMIVIYIMINFYIGWNGFMLLSTWFPSISSTIYGLIFSIVALSFIIGRIAALGAVGRLLKVIGSYYVFVLEYAMLILPVANLTAWGLGRFVGDIHAFVPIIGLIVIGLLAILIAVGSWNAWSPVLRTYQIHIAKDVEGLQSLRIVMASDFHLGNVVGRRHLRKFVDHIQGSQPDVVLLAGDIIDDSIEPFMRNRLEQEMSQIKARYGTYAVLGNHEYYGGHREKFIAEMGKLHIPVLQDEVQLAADRFYIAGRKDKTSERFDPEGRKSVDELLEGISRQRPVFLMDHQPNEYDEAMAAGVDLIVSGHTHRGQFFPNQYFTKRMFELDWGHLLKDGRMHAIVSSGFGTWGPPIRLGSRAEIVEIEVTFN